MEREDQRLARRFAALSLDARRHFLKKLHEAGLSFAELPIVRADRGDPIPISYAQRSLWLTWKLDPASAAYNLPGAIRFKGALNADALLSAVRALIERHETLHTILQAGVDGDPIQAVMSPSDIATQFVDLSRIPEHLRFDELDRLQHRFAHAPFMLDAEPPVRTVLWKLGDNDHVLGIVLHHVAGDGISARILIQELLHLYQIECDPSAERLQPLPVQFADYVVWQRNWFEAGEKERQLAYWRAQLGDTHPVLDLPFDRARGSSPQRKEGRHQFRLSAGTSAGLAALAKTHDATLFMVMLGLFMLLLRRLSGERDMRVGVPTANRQRAEVRGMIACLTNVLVLRARVETFRTFSDLLGDVRKAVLDAHGHPDLPFDLLVEALRPEREPNVNPLFQVKCTQQDDVPIDWKLPGLEIQVEDFSAGEAHFDLSLDFVDGADGVEAILAYPQELFDHDSIQRFAHMFDILAKQVVERPESKLSELHLGEKSSCLLGERRAFANADVLGLWTESVRRFKNRTAVRDERRAYSYEELDVQSDGLAAELVDHNIGPEARVGVLAARSCEFVLGVLAALKAGAAYVPLDPQLPAERLAFQADDSGVRALLCAGSPAWAISTPMIRLAFDGEMNRRRYLRVSPHPEQGAYVVYTSGSTGKPKGVVVTREALANYVQAVLAQMDLPERATEVAMASTVAADLGNTSLFGALCSGRTLHLVSQDRAFDPDAFAQFMADRRIDVLKIVPSHLRALMAASAPADVLPTARLVVGGEATRWPMLDQIAALKPGCAVLNHYGPTETTVGVLTQEARDATRLADSLPMGKPLANCDAYVLDAELDPVPQGVAGELYLGGAGLARGYLSRAAQTADRFIAHPFRTGGRLYRTGDRVKALKDGSLEFLGRVDDQVKIRGYRVELREVAYALRQQQGIAEAEVVATRDDGARDRLDAYVVALPGERIDLDRVRASLTRTLPDYMMPSAIMALDALPLTVNGKVDRKALPAPPHCEAKGHAAPQGRTEEALARVWAEVFGVERVGRDDDFFELGGDSILALKLVARARKHGVHMLPKQLLAGKTLAGVARLMDEASAKEEEESTQPKLQRAPRTLLLLASAAQLRQWFLWRLAPSSTAYHISGALRLEGVLDVSALWASFAALVERHESLRTVFRADAEGRVEQHILAAMPIEAPLIDLGEVAEAEREGRMRERAQAICDLPFDLTQGPLLRVAVIRTGEKEHVLVVVMHHIVSDGWSMQIIVEEFVAQYRARLRGEAAALEPLPIQYADYAAWQRNWLEAGEKERQLSYWRGQLGAEHPVLQLPTDHPRKAEGGYRAGRYAVEAPARLIAALQRRAQAEEATLFMALLAGLQALLHRYAGESDIRVGVPIANRHRAETEGVVGFFVNTQVLRNVVEPRRSFSHLLRRTREAALGAQAHQDLPFEQLVEALQPDRNLGTNPLFQVMFNHQRQDRRALQDLPGLRLTELSLGDQGAQFELAVDSVEDSDGRLMVTFSYARELFDAATIERMAGHYMALLEALAERPDQAVGDVDLLGAAERGRLLEWGANDRRFSDVEPVHRLFERQARSHPEAVAVTFEGASLTYGELNARANRLAHRLIALGVKPDGLVGVAVERSLEMVVSLLAVLKAGGAYVPLDPDYPADRLAYMAQDSGIALLLTQARVKERLSFAAGLTTLELDRLDVDDQSDLDPSVAVHAESLAYVIYTSGSTGRPKGVAIRHRSLASCMMWMQDAYGLAGADAVLHKAPFGFDVSVWEIFWPLTSGARLVVANPGDHRDPERIVELIRRHEITTLNFVPAMLQAFLAHEGVEERTRLRHVICGGEAMPAATQREALQRLHGASLENLYGPTETTIHVTQWRCRDDGRSRVPIGRPIAETQAHVLDEGLAPTPVGVSGELYIGGELLARGYLHRAGLSAERFIADPFDDRGGRLYRTGDLARWSSEGELEYLGRLDDQVKVRGFRVELGEIEAQLLAQSEVREAAVVAQAGPGGSRLVGYVSAASGRTIDPSALRARLRERLPDHMTPSAIVVLESLPLNANGKIDRKALPAAEFVSDRGYEAPQGEVEEALAAIWAETLGVERIGRNDNFFELGGDSISALRVVTSARSRNIRGLTLTLRDLIGNPTIHAISARRNSTMLLNQRVFEREPLFCIHSALGTVLGYLSLAKSLNGVRSVYGLSCRTLVDPSHRDVSLDTMADDYVELMRATQNDGPYHLLGWSLGGILATLIAARLERIGQEVRFLGLIDPPLPSGLARQVATGDWREGYAYLLGRVGEKSGEHLQIPDEISDPLDSEQPLLEWTRSLINAGLLRPQGQYAGLEAEDLTRACLISRTLGLATEQFSGSLPPVAAPVYCWWSKGRQRAVIDEVSSQLRTARIFHSFTESDHESIVSSPALLNSLAELMRVLTIDS